MHVWRRLRSLGAVYLQSSVCVLPATPEVVRELRRLSSRVRGDGGSIRVMEMVLTDTGQESDLIAEFNASREQEYQELLERVPEFVNELETERGKGRVTYAEVEESETDLRRFQEWLAKIAVRDYFHASAQEQARAAVTDCEHRLREFEADALTADDPPSPQRLRAVPSSRPASRTRRRAQ